MATTAQQNLALGAYGERLAARYLIGLGMTVIDRNWRCSAGEIDLVLREAGALVFCEVKTRRSVERGHPLEAVGPGKAARLERLASEWVEEHGLTGTPWRIDLVGVLLPRRATAVVEHVRGIG